MNEKRQHFFFIKYFSINSLNINSWDVYNKLFDSLVTPLLLFAAPVYAIRCLSEIKTVQFSFFKNLLSLPHSTPNYAVTLDTGRAHLKVTVLKQVLNWLIKVV